MHKTLTVARWSGIIATCAAGWYLLAAGHWQAACFAFLASAVLQYIPRRTNAPHR